MENASPGTLPVTHWPISATPGELSVRKDGRLVKKVNRLQDRQKTQMHGEFFRKVACVGNQEP